jgi:bis(5'-nucleosyl)-tetraphosphatase (symmetrical)
MAVYAIGDVQGCYDPFRRLLDELRFDPGSDTLWLTGDLVNRGPKSLKTLRFIVSLGDSVVSVLGNHDLHLLAVARGAVDYSSRFSDLRKLLNAPDLEEMIEWLRRCPLAHYDESLNALLVHAGTHPQWSVEQTLARAAEVEKVLRGKSDKKLLSKMYGNTPATWSRDLSGYKRLRFIVNCLTRMRMMTHQYKLNLAHSGPPWTARARLGAWFDFEDRACAGTRVVFGHWSALGLLVMPELVSLDTGCVWGRQLTAVRLDKRVPRVYQVAGQA